MKYLLIAVLLIFGCISEPEPAVNDSKLQELEEKVSDLEEHINGIEEKVDRIEESMESMEIAEETEEGAEDELHVQFVVTVENIGGVPLMDGVFAVHKPPASISFLGTTIPESFRAMIFERNSSGFGDYVGSIDGVQNVYIINDIDPGSTRSFTISVIRDRPRETYLSGIFTIEGDVYAKANNIALFNVGNGPRTSSTIAENYDGGVLDGSTNTSRPVIISPVYTKPSMRVIVTPKG